MICYLGWAGNRGGEYLDDTSLNPNKYILANLFIFLNFLWPITSVELEIEG